MDLEATPLSRFRRNAWLQMPRVMSHCSVDPKPESAPAGIQVVQAAVNKTGVFIYDGRSFADNSIAFLKTVNVLAGLKEYAGELVT